MSAPFDLLIFGQRKINAAAGSSPSQETLTKVRLRIIQQVFNERRLVCRNRVEANRRNLILSTIENAHKREQATQRAQKENILTELKQEKYVIDSSLALSPSYEPVDLSTPKDLYRFGTRLQSAGPHVRSRAPEIHSDLTRSNRENNQSRAKSASVLPRSHTAPLQTVHHEDIESDDEAISTSVSCITSNKSSHSRATPAVSSTNIPQHSPELPTNNPDTITPSVQSTMHRITWPIRLKVFALQNEDEARQQFLNWLAEKRKTKKESIKKQFDLELQQQYQESIRRRKELEAFVTPDIIEEHIINDSVFAKRYRQLQLAVRTGKVPNYDPKDRDINIIMTKSKIERVRTALITAKQSRIKNFYRNQQIINDAILSERVETFLKRLAEFNQEQVQEI
ncbi:unnamed protein product [Rotaria sp. Silwood2]|nr:unnamed protein product [Rotaria sp. Silwood2]CAF2941940.1 unnamed protein product [Rotaria sp. Silwood2]CAF3104110.1 unnamed protein product [Rotaria sp. Silwood2]CAF3927119.1 unnamed protein product [Rotaria sp. Silwood2]CAF4001290.1 unnamed protein product [Rotaria sp. Silwood2]